MKVYNVLLTHEIFDNGIILDHMFEFRTKASNKKELSNEIKKLILSLNKKHKINLKLHSFWTLDQTLFPSNKNYKKEASKILKDEINDLNKIKNKNGNLSKAQFEAVILGKDKLIKKILNQYKEDSKNKSIFDLLLDELTLHKEFINKEYLDLLRRSKNDVQARNLYIKKIRRELQSLDLSSIIANYI